jgi:hypothetical protein
VQGARAGVEIRRFDDIGGHDDVASNHATLGALQLLAAARVMAGNQLARWFGVAMLGLNAIDQMLFIPAYPFWSLSIIAMDIVALWGLCAYGSRENVAA